MSFPTTSILDTFIRADENPLSDGAKWTGPFFISTDVTFKLLSNQAVSTSPTVETSNYWSASTFGPDSEAYVDLTVVNTTVSYGVSVWCDCSGEGGVGGTVTGYNIRAVSNATTITFTIRKSVSGIATTLGTSSAQPMWQNGDKLGVGYVNHLLVGYNLHAGAEWVQMLSITDSSITQVGHLGFVSNVVASGTSPTFNNFGGGTYVALPTFFPDEDFYNLPVFTTTPGTMKTW